MFLKDYAAKKEKKLISVLRKFSFKMKLQKQRRKMVYFRRITVTNIF